MPTLCRACSTLTDCAVDTCPDCASGRLIRHDAIREQTIAHIDCDAFFAAIEKRDAPELRSKPVIIGGGRRGVVATCCYIARISGVRSAMPMFKALKACPDAVVVRPNFTKYKAAADEVRAMFKALTPLVQAVSIDEAYLDLSGTEALHGASPASLLATLARDIEAQVGITVSIGLSGNKFLAKTASELDKPRGFAVIDPAEAPALLAPLSPGSLHGVGPKLNEKLAGLGYETIADIQATDLKTLISTFGETGLFLHERAAGIDKRPVTPGSERKSVSSEITFDTDISDLSMLTDRLWNVCERTSARAKAAGVEGSVVTLKLKAANFKTLTRRVTLSDATQLARTLFEVCKPMLARECESGRSFRLIGVGISSLQDARGDSVDLVDPSIAKRARAERASDAARAKFGDDAVQTARAFRSRQARGEIPSGARRD